MEKMKLKCRKYSYKKPESVDNTQPETRTWSAYDQLLDDREAIKEICLLTRENIARLIKELATTQRSYEEYLDTLADMNREVEACEKARREKGTDE